MENQINVGDQNSQQIGQNPIGQPAQFPEKIKANYWVISTVVLLVILLMGGMWFILNTKSKISSDQQTITSSQTNQPTTQPPHQIIKSAPMILFMQTNLPDYSKHKDGSVILSSLDTANNQKTEIMNFDACCLNPTLSPDKTKIAYVIMSNSECEKEYYTNVGNAELWVYDFKDKTKQSIASGVWKFVAPQWSLDGNYLSYERVTDSPQSREQKVYLYNMASKEEKLVTTLTGVSSGLIALAADNNFFYFETPLTDLLKIDVQSGTQKKLFTADFGYNATFYLSPDRTKMAVFSIEGWYGGKKTPLNWKIGVIDLVNDVYKELYNGSDQLSLLTADRLGNNPVITNDSQVIYGITGQNAGLWSINLLNGAKTKIHAESPNLQGISTVDLSLNGKYLLYGTWFIEKTSSTESLTRWHFYVINLSDNNVQELKDFDYQTEKAIYLMN